MPGIINSSPECVTSVNGAEPADDSADFILQAAYEDCGGIMTFGPGSTYGEEGEAANAAYYILTWLGIAFMIAVLVAWVVWENRQLIRHAMRLGGTGPEGPAGPGPVPQRPLH